MRIRVLHTEGFRIAAIFAAIFALSTAVLAGVTLVIVDQEFRDQIVQFSNADIAAVKDGYRTEGVGEAREVINQRMAAPGASDFFLLERGQSEKLAGNLDVMRPRTGAFTLRYPGKPKGHEILGVGAFVAPDLYVFSGSDLFRARQTRQRILRTLIWVFIGATILALISGTIVSRSFLRRTDSIVRTCRAIMAGNLSSRIAPRGTDDEFDRLSETINSMLDRISALMDNLGQVTNDIAHDLRTPVTHLRHRLERARNQAVTPEDYVQSLDAAIAASDEILALFGAHLRIAQIEGGARRAGFSAVDLRALLEQMREMYAPVAEDSGHHLVLDQMDPATISGDRELLVQLLSNLIENAIVHTPAGTRITLSLARADGHAIVTVADNGPGVPAQEHDKLFRRLYRREASRTRPGYGLGLALVAAISDLHGVKLSTDRTALRGFSVSLAFALSPDPP